MQSVTLPKIVKSGEIRDIGDFPMAYYSSSALTLFTTNPILFRIKYLNKEVIESTRSISSIIGQAFHNAMEVYYSESDVKNGLDPVKIGLETGMQFLEDYPEGFMEFNSKVATKTKAQEVFAFLYSSYLRDKEDKEEKIVGCEMLLEHQVSVSWRGQKLILPVPLKGYVDKLIREDGKLKIVDYKTCSRFSDPDKIDGAKIIQAVQYYLLVLTEYGEAPYSMVYEEIKATKNRDGSKQLKRYEIVFGENEQFFDFYFRLYDDVTRAINGESVWVPNIHSFFDNEIAIVSYIHRLDEPQEKASLMKQMQATNITDLLKKQIQNAGSMRKFLATVEKKFQSGKSINYENMTIEERITTKIMEHGMLLEHIDTINGFNVDLYRFNPKGIGIKMGRLTSFTSDIEQAVGRTNIRILAPIPNSTYVGVEVPKQERTFPDTIPNTKGFDVAVGVNVFGENYTFDLREAPHLLVCGSSGSGKSVFLNSIIEQLSHKKRTDLYLFDPKKVELSYYEDRAKQYLDDDTAIALSLHQQVMEMERRYKKMKKQGLRSIENTKMRYRFIVIDEFGDLSLGSEFSKDIMKSITLLAQKARACGIHLIISTQRPSVDVITGTIKNNFPTKAVFRVGRSVDSNLVLDEGGAEKLLGKGDMIFRNDRETVRLQGYNI